MNSLAKHIQARRVSGLYVGVDEAYRSVSHHPSRRSETTNRVGRRVIEGGRVGNVSRRNAAGVF
jgi:hypothetical protein